MASKFLGFIVAVYTLASIGALLIMTINYDSIHYSTTRSENNPIQRENISQSGSIQEPHFLSSEEEPVFSRQCVHSPAHKCSAGKAKHLPKVLIIGVTKSGTTALEWFLLLHKQIQSGVGEPHFFDWHYDKGEKWYCRQMPCTTENVIVLERTPRYYIHDSAKNIHDFDPNMKLLLIVREPVDRTVSHLVHNYGTRKTWTEMKKRIYNSTADTAIETSHQVYMSLYYKYLSRWTAYFSRKQILIIDYKDLIKSPYDVVHQVETFLNLEHKIKPEMIYFDKHKEFYCKYTNLSKHIKTCMGGAKGRKHPKVPKEDVDKLKRFYKPWNEKWFNAVGHDFGWNDGVE